MKLHLMITPLAVALAVAALTGAGARGGTSEATCRHADVVFYSTDSNRLAQRLHANQSACADFYISTTPAGDLISPRKNIAPLIRANGLQFHAMPEFRLDEWATWLADPANAGKTWFDAGVEFRRRMVAADFDVAKGDTWIINDVGWPTRSTIGGAVFSGTGTARADLLELIHGLYTGDTGMPPAPGAVFGAGPVQATTDLDRYRRDLQAWYADSAFWRGLNGYVRFWAQDTWADARASSVPGTTLAQRAAYLDDYFMHPSRLATGGGGDTEAARGFFADTYTPLGNAAFRWGAPSTPGPGFGSTDIGLTGMQSFVSTQSYALRSASAGRFGFGVVPNAATSSETIAVEDQIASSIHGSEADPNGACGAGGQWCDGVVDDAQFNDGWKSFANTLEGSPVRVQIPPAVTVTLATVDARGATGVETAPVASPAPQHLQIRPGALSYRLETSSLYGGPVEVCVAYDGPTYDGYAPRLFELVSADWSDVTTSVGASDVCGTAPSLGTFAIFAADPTPPLITPHLAGPKGSADWYAGDVSVSWDVSDPQSPILSSSGCEPTTITSDTAGTTLTCAATSDGGPASVPVTVERDTTPPTLAVPASVVLDATSPTGGAAVFAATAVDTLDPAPAVVCAPASGSPFAIGTTTVTCTATDAAGNKTQASFPVQVKGAAEQLRDLVARLVAALPIQIGLRTALLAPLKSATERFDPENPNDVQRAMTLLRAFTVLVQTGERVGLIPTAIGDPLVTDATRIVRVLGG